MRNPIPKCLECGKPIVRQKKVRVRGGFRLAWKTNVKYCSNACRQAAYRNRKRAYAFAHWAERGI